MRYVTHLAVVSGLMAVFASPLLANDIRHVRHRDGSTTWLGIQLNPVPAAVAAHLQLRNKGVMVRNVFKDSPADRAGLDRYDVIVQVGNKPVAGGIEAVKTFSEHVRAKLPGDELRLGLIHEGETKKVVIQLEAMPADWDEMELKYEDDPDVAFRREFDLRGKILRPGPNGWELDDLRDMPGWRKYRDAIKKHLHEKGIQDWLPWADEPGIDQGRRVDKQGRVLHVQRREDGTIEVKRYRRTDGEEKADIAVYEDMNALRQGDPEAYALLRPGTNGKWHKKKCVPKRWVPPHWPPGSEPLKPDPRWQEWMERFFQGPMEYFRDDGVVPPSKPEKTQEAEFEVGVDGTITVHVRDNRTSLRMTFKSRKELQKRAPELYERFVEMKRRIR